MANKKSKRHHHIPRMILKRFSPLGREGGIYFYDSLKGGKIQDRNIVSVAREDDLYSVISEGIIDVSLEEHFSAIESNADLILDKIFFLGINQLSSDEISFLIMFVISLMYRSRRFVKLAGTFSGSDNIKEILHSTAKENNFSQETADKFYDDLVNIKGFAYQKTFEFVLQERHEKFIEHFDVLIATCEGSYPKFILQDNYATIIPVGSFSNLTDKSLWEHPIQIICPISADASFIFIPKSKNLGKKMFNLSTKEVGHNFVMDVNRVSFNQKERYMYGSCLFEMTRLIDSNY